MDLDGGTGYGQADGQDGWLGIPSRIYPFTFPIIGIYCLVVHDKTPFSSLLFDDPIDYLSSCPRQIVLTMEPP